MAAGSGVSMPSGSPAKELSLSVQQAGNPIHGDRAKTEEVTGKNVTRSITMLSHCVYYNESGCSSSRLGLTSTAANG